MNPFNKKLKEIKILEIIGIAIIFIFLIVLLELDIEWISILLIIYILFRTRKEINGIKDSTTTIFSKISAKTWLLLGITSYIFALGSGLFLENTLSDYPLFYILESMNTAEDRILFFGIDFLTTVIVGPIAEELLFRGIILNRFNKRLPILIAILLSSTLFCLFHPQEAIVSTFIFGITMCIVYLTTDNIIVPITLHMLNNLISFSIPYIPNLEIYLTSQSGIIILEILAIISLIYIMYFNLKNYSNIQELKK